MDAIIIPEILKSICKKLSLIGNVGIDQKINYKNEYYINRDSYYGSVLRYFESEKQSTVGNAYLENLCNETINIYNTYKDNSNFTNLLFINVVNARKGLMRLRNTYSKINYQDKTLNCIDGCIMQLDFILPKDIKIEHGFILDEHITDL
jgi:hypothetical protein